MGGIKVRRAGQPEILAGLPGKSAYQAAVSAGFIGTEAQWLTSLQGYSPTFVGARVRLTTGLAPASTGTLLSWTVEDYDSTNLHSNTTNPSRLTVPAGLSGTYEATATLAQDLSPITTTNDYSVNPLTTTPAKFTPSVGTWSYDATGKYIQQTDTGTAGAVGFMSEYARVSDFDFSADVTFQADAQGRKHWGFGIQAADGATWTGYRVVNLDAGPWIVQKYAAGTPGANVTSTNSSNPNPVVGQTYRMRFVWSAGANASLYVNGALVLTFTDTQYPLMRPGFWAYGANLRITNLSYTYPQNSNRFGVRLRKNGTTMIPGGAADVSLPTGTSVSAPLVLTATTSIPLNAGDYIEALAYANGGAIDPSLCSFTLNAVSGAGAVGSPGGGGGGTVSGSIDALSDVDTTTTAPTTGQALVWDATAGQWKPGSVASGSGGGGTVDAASVINTMFVFYDSTSSTYPARPSVSHPVIFYGSGNPTGVMLNGDTWLDPSPGTSTNGSSDYDLAYSVNVFNDEFDGTSTAVWTTTTTAPSVNNLTDRGGSLKLTSHAGAVYTGRTQPIPTTFPFTVTTKVLSNNTTSNYQRGGGLIFTDAAGNNSSPIVYSGQVYSNGYGMQRTYQTGFGSTFQSQNTALLPGYVGLYYMRAIFTNSTTATLQVSTDGWAWRTMEVYSFPFTVARMGLGSSEEGVDIGGVTSYFDWFRVKVG